jgi:hypothetical protein
MGRTTKTVECCWLCHVHDALCLSPGFGPPPTTAESGLFDFNTFRQIVSVGDRTSNTFMMGEAVGGYPLCHGIGCDQLSPGRRRPMKARGREPCFEQEGLEIILPRSPGCR